MILNILSRLAHDSGALKNDDLGRITVDTTVQPKNVTHPTDAKLMLKAIGQLGALTKRHGVALRQSYVRAAQRTVAGRPATARPWSQPNRLALRAFIAPNVAKSGC